VPLDSIASAQTLAMPPLVWVPRFELVLRMLTRRFFVSAQRQLLGRHRGLQVDPTTWLCQQRVGLGAAYNVRGFGKLLVILSKWKKGGRRGGRRQDRAKCVQVCPSYRVETKMSSIITEREPIGPSISIILVAFPERSLRFLPPGVSSRI
jgi:hypothetical protein